MSPFKKLTFLKVLTVIAWADGEVTQSELNILKSFYRKFDLSQDEIDALKPYLHAPLPQKDQEKLFDMLTAEMQSPQDKKEFIQALSSMAEADNNIHKAERMLVQQLSTLIEETSFAKVVFGKARNLLVRTIFKPARDKNPQLEKYFKNIILNKIALKASGGNHKISLPEDQIYRVCLFGVLLGSVAYVDENFSGDEKAALLKILRARYSFADEELSILIDIIEEQSTWGFDFHEVVTEINRLVSYSDRLMLMDCFFEMAAADGELSYEEIEEIRRITKSMHIPHKNFIDCKMKYLEKFR